MGGWTDDARAARLLRAAAVTYAVVVAVHVADHLRRGVDASPDSVVALGLLALVAQGVAVGAVLTGRAWAPVAAVAVALPDAVGVVAVHLLPDWGPVSDAFPGAPPGAGVTAFSWATGIAEVAAGLAFASAGWVVWRGVTGRRARRGAPAPSARSAS